MAQSSHWLAGCTQSLRNLEPLQWHRGPLILFEGQRVTSQCELQQVKAKSQTH